DPRPRIRNPLEALHDRPARGRADAIETRGFLNRPLVEQQDDEGGGEPAAEAARAPARLDDEQPVQIGARERPEDVGGRAGAEPGRKQARARPRADERGLALAPATPALAPDGGEVGIGGARVAKGLEHVEVALEESAVEVD